MPTDRLKRAGLEFESSLEGACVEEADGSCASSSLPHPTRLGRYRIVCELASGGMATVYLAIADGLDKLLALKIMHSHLVKDQAFLSMFLDEARIASGILHRNVCSVFDHGEHNGSYYIAMDYLAGRTLREVIRALRTSQHTLGESAHLFMAYVIAQACEGLHAAHELRGTDGELLHVVHRDVTPQNLFVTYDGHVSVIDFGIARAADRLHQTAAGVLKGKFSYMAPEQLRQGEGVDRRADIWALGVSLWEALTRRRLFARTAQAETLMSVLSSEILPPSWLDPSVPAALDAIVMRALSRDVEQRYPSARELGLDLTKLCRESGFSVGPVEIEQFMAELFPREIERAFQLEQQAKQSAAQERMSHLSACTPSYPGVLQSAVPPCCEISAPLRAGSERDAAPAAARPTLEISLPAPATKPRAATARVLGWALLCVAVLGLAVFGHARWRWAWRGGQQTPAAPGREASHALSRSTGTAPAASDPRRVARSASEQAAAGRPQRALALAPGVRPSKPGQLAVGHDAKGQAVAPERSGRAFTANVSFTGVRTAGSLMPSVVARMLDRAGPLVRDCYLEAAGRSGAELPTSVPMWFSIDEAGAVRDGSLGAQARPQLAACVIQALRRVHSDQRPEDGVVNVAAELKFQATL